MLRLRIDTTRVDIKTLPNNKFLDWSKLKAFADDKISDLKNEIYFGNGRKYFGKRRKCWSPFSTILEKASFSRLLSGDCVVKS